MGNTTCWARPEGWAEDEERRQGEGVQNRRPLLLKRSPSPISDSGLGLQLPGDCAPAGVSTQEPPTQATTCVLCHRTPPRVTSGLSQPWKKWVRCQKEQDEENQGEKAKLEEVLCCHGGLVVSPDNLAAQRPHQEHHCRLRGTCPCGRKNRHGTSRQTDVR